MGWALQGKTLNFLLLSGSFGLHDLVRKWTWTYWCSVCPPTLFPWRNQDGYGFAHTAVVLDNCVFFFFFITHIAVTTTLYGFIYSLYIDISLDYLLKGNFCWDLLYMVRAAWKFLSSLVQPSLFYRRECMLWNLEYLPQLTQVVRAGGFVSAESWSSAVQLAGLHLSNVLSNRVFRV